MPSSSAAAAPAASDANLHFALVALFCAAILPLHELPEAIPPLTRAVAPAGAVEALRMICVARGLDADLVNDCLMDGLAPSEAGHV